MRNLFFRRLRGGSVSAADEVGLNAFLSACGYFSAFTDEEITALYDFLRDRTLTPAEK